MFFPICMGAIRAEVSAKRNPRLFGAGWGFVGARVGSSKNGAGTPAVFIFTMVHGTELRTRVFMELICSVHCLEHGGRARL